MLMYHMTQAQNIESIVKRGIRPNFGEVYICKSPEDCVKMMGVRMMAQGGTWYCLAVSVRESEIKESFDHDPRFFGGAKSYVVNRTLWPIWNKSKMYELGEYE